LLLLLLLYAENVASHHAPRSPLARGSKGNFTLYAKDMYLAENKARLVGSSQMRRVLAPQRVGGGVAALNPPLAAFNGNVFDSAATQNARPASAPGGFFGTQPIKAQWEPGQGPNAQAASSAQLTADMRQTFGSFPGDEMHSFTSAYRLASHFEGDHAEAYEGQWGHSKTITGTARGVRQAGERAVMASAPRRPGVAREGRTTVKRHLGPSRPHTTTGLMSNTADLGATSSATDGPHLKPPPGRWAQPDRGRQLPLVLVDHRTRDGVRAGFFEASVYGRDQSDAHTNFGSCNTWASKASSHGASAAWKRPPNTLLTGQVYKETVSRKQDPS
jgi:hypothetical protein